MFSESILNSGTQTHCNCSRNRKVFDFYSYLNVTVNKSTNQKYYLSSFIQLNAVSVDADEGLQDGLSPEQRNCYYPDEKPLSFYIEYSYDNCVTECKLTKAYEQFGCLLWSSPSNYNRLF